MTTDITKNYQHNAMNSDRSTQSRIGAGPVLTIPLPLVQEDETSWPAIVAAMQRLGAGRVILYGAMLPNPANSIRHYRARLGSAADQDPALLSIAPDLRFYDLWAELLAERRAQFEAVGIQVAFWMGQTLGHPDLSNGSSNIRPPFQHEMDADGKELDHCLCPLCPSLRKYLTGALARIARAQPEFIILDDDFRLSRQNPNWCVCPLHLAEFRRRGLPDLPRHELLQRMLSGAPGPERAAWWSVYEESHIDLGRAMGEAIRAVAPQVRLGLCSTQSAWDDLDLPRLLSAMAGPLQPLVRLHGAPYWLTGHQPAFNLGGLVEQTRMQRGRLRASLPAVEALCEGDSFPHLSTRVAVSTFDAWHQSLLAAGARQFLSYACSYVSPLRFETGYTSALERQRTRYATICELAPADAVDLGLSVPWRPGAMRRLTNPPATERTLMAFECPPPMQLCARLGIPVAHDDTQTEGPVLLTGRQAALASDVELEAWAARGLVLDAVAAAVLQQRGIACGIAETAPAQAPNVEHFLADAHNGPFAGGSVAMWSPSTDVYHRITPLPGAVVVSVFKNAAGDDWGPAVLRWQDDQNRRFVILGWDLGAAFAEFQLLWSHARRYQLQRLLAWVGRAPLPCTVDTANVHVTVRRRSDGGTIIGVLNCGLDPLEPVLRLTPALTAARRIRLLPPEGSTVVTVDPVWQDDGDARLLALPCRVPAHGFCLLSLDL